jgi:hypothetical protein
MAQDNLESPRAIWLQTRKHTASRFCGLEPVMQSRTVGSAAFRKRRANSESRFKRLGNLVRLSAAALEVSVSFTAVRLSKVGVRLTACF